MIRSIPVLVPDTFAVEMVLNEGEIYMGHALVKRWNDTANPPGVAHCVVAGSGDRKILPLIIVSNLPSRELWGAADMLKTWLKEIRDANNVGSEDSSGGNASHRDSDRSTDKGAGA